MNAKRAIIIPAVCLGISAFSLGLGLSLLSQDMTVAWIAFICFLTGSLPSFLALWFSTREDLSSVDKNA